MFKQWGESDLSQNNRAEKPWYEISGNGKVDIGKGRRDIDKIGLTSLGMFELVKDWVLNTSVHEIELEQRDELIALLSKK